MKWSFQQIVRGRRKNRPRGQNDVAPSLPNNANATDDDAHLQVTSCLLSFSMYDLKHGCFTKFFVVILGRYRTLEM